MTVNMIKTEEETFEVASFKKFKPDQANTKDFALVNNDPLSQQTFKHKSTQT